MMTPSQINTQRFNTVTKGGYRTVEVDAFLQKIYQYYSRLYSDNNELHERVEAMSSLVAEYEKSKSAIAQALIWAQAKADESMEESKKLASSIIAEASQEAEKLLVVKKAEAEAYYAERTKVAEDKLKAAEENFAKVKADAESFSEKYINDVNSKAQKIIAEATEKASSIVASAYADAKTAREKADEIVAQANRDLDGFKMEIAQLKKEMNKFISHAQSAVEKLSIDENFSMIEEKEADIPEVEIKEPEISEFTYKNELLEDIGKVTESSVEKENKAEAFLNELEEQLPPIDLISQQGGNAEKPKAEIPDVNSYISKIFDSVATEKKEKVAKFSIDYKTDLDDLISEVLEGDKSINETAEDETDDSDMKKYHIGETTFDDDELFYNEEETFGGDEEFE